MTPADTLVSGVSIMRTWGQYGENEGSVWMRFHTIGPATVYLFGSYSKGCARPDSDIDIAVVVPSINGDYYSTAAHL